MVTDKEIEEAFEAGRLDRNFHTETQEFIADYPYTFGKFCFQVGAKWMQEKMKEENERLMKLVIIGARLSRAVLEEDAEI